MSSIFWTSAVFSPVLASSYLLTLAGDQPRCSAACSSVSPALSPRRRGAAPAGVAPAPQAPAAHHHRGATPPLRVGRQGNPTGDPCHKLDRTAAITPVGQ